MALAHRVGTEFAAHTPGPSRPATLFPEPGVAEYLGAAVAAGARVVKVHVQVGGFDPRDPLLRPAWGLLAEAGAPASCTAAAARCRARTPAWSVRRGAGRAPAPDRGARPRGAPEFGAAFDLAAPLRARLPRHDDGRGPVQPAGRPAPARLAARLVDVADRVVLGTDFPNIPYPYAEQVRAIAGWAAADDRLGEPFLRSVLHDAPARLLGETAPR